MVTGSLSDDDCAELYLHVGVHKTGTTAIQKFLHDNQDVLRRSGLHLIQTGLPDATISAWGHHALAWALRDGDRDGLWPAAAREAMGHSRALISSEEFAFFRKTANYAPVQAAFAGTRVRPICYLRRQDQLLESLYNHHVKSLGEVRPIMEFAQQAMHRLDYAGLVDCLAQAFGVRNIVLRTYDRQNLKGDIVRDFMDAIGPASITGWHRPAKSLNLGLSRAGMERMLEANRAYADNLAVLTKARRDIVNAYSAPAFSDHGLLKPSERAELMNRFRSGNDDLARRYLGRDRLF